MSNRELPPIAKELIAAKKRIEDPENWCQGQFYLEGRVCARGAIHEVQQASDFIVYTEGSAKMRADLALDAASTELFDQSPVYVNDILGHAAVMQMYDHAIAKAISEGK